MSVRAHSCSRSFFVSSLEDPPHLRQTLGMGNRPRSTSRSGRSQYRTVGGREPIATTAGVLAARAWLAANSLDAPSLARWYASVTLATDDMTPPAEVDEAIDTRFRIEIYSEEWGFLF